MMNNCRLCSGTELRMFLNLGFTPPADGFLRLDQLHEPETHYPLEVCQCSGCGFVQLNHVVSPETLYRHDYPFAPTRRIERCTTTASRPSASKSAAMKASSDT